jgi:two-component system LytT family sensor kinase
VAFEGLRSRWYARQLGSDADLATFRTLHTASLASPALREGLNPASVERSLRHLRNLLGTPAVAIADTHTLQGYDGLSTHHADQAHELARRAIEATSTVVAGRTELACSTQGCLVEHAIASPLVIDNRVAGALVALTHEPSASLLRATEEVASWVSGQLELAELDESRHRLVRAEVRALRAQISPHFIYNSLGAIASFVRTDPDRARDLLLEFADFTRYSFRQHGDFTTLAEELRSVERYLLLEQARFGDRLRVTLQVAPEVLGVSIPFLCLQPLVENAVQHGLESVATGGHISIEARDADRECVISIEDNGTGQDPARIREVLSGESTGDAVGLANVDERLRTTFGDEYGLVVETAPGAGTKVVVRVPKFAPGVTPRARHRDCACWSSTTSAPRSTSSPTCSSATNGSPRCTRPTPPPTRSGCCSSSRWTRSSSTSRCPGSPASSWPRC